MLVLFSLAFICLALSDIISLAFSVR